MRAAIDAVRPEPLVRAALSRTHLLSSARTLYVIAAGKAAWPMAHGLAGTSVPIAEGLIAGPRARRQSPSIPFAWIGGAHPAPDALSADAGARALAMAARSVNGTLVVLLSGGASSMLAAPAPGVSLDDKAVTASALMRAGAAIAALNCVRKHLSAIKGGRLAAAARATITLAISDVHAPVEDDPAVIGSGPTVADPSTFADALRVVTESFPGAGVPAGVIAHLERGVRGEIEDTPKPGDSRLARSAFHVIANRHTAMDAAAAAARAMGCNVRVVGAPTSGQAREAGRRFAELAVEGGAGPRIVIATGETTVHVRGGGRGGRNQEFALGAASLLRDFPGSLVASIGTDGVDGPTEAAGGVVDSTTVERVRGAGLSIATALDHNDAYPLLAALGDLIVLGPTGTNVGDLHVALIA